MKRTAILLTCLLTAPTAWGLCLNYGSPSFFDCILEESQMRTERAEREFEKNWGYLSERQIPEPFEANNMHAPSDLRKLCVVRNSSGAARRACLRDFGYID